MGRSTVRASSVGKHQLPTHDTRIQKEGTRKRARVPGSTALTAQEVLGGAQAALLARPRKTRRAVGRLAGGMPPSRPQLRRLNGCGQRRTEWPGSSGHPYAVRSPCAPCRRARRGRWLAACQLAVELTGRWLIGCILVPADCDPLPCWCLRDTAAVILTVRGEHRKCLAFPFARSQLDLVHATR